MQNLVEFLYTGEIVFNGGEKELEIFQQLICQLQIGLDDKYAIFIDQFLIENNSKQEPSSTESHVLLNSELIIDLK